MADSRLIRATAQKVFIYFIVAALTVGLFFFLLVLKAYYASSLHFSFDFLFLLAGLIAAWALRPVLAFLKKSTDVIFLKDNLSFADFTARWEDVLKSDEELASLLSSLLSLLVEPHGLTSVAPPHASSGGTLRSVPSFAKATEDYPSRIHPRTNVRGLLRRRVEGLGAEKAAFVLRNGYGLPLVVKEGYGSKVEAVSLELIKLGSRQREVVLSSALSASQEGKELLEEVDAEVLAPLISENLLVGLLLLGKRKGGSAYGRQEIELLRTLAEKSAAAIQNLQFCQEEISFTEELRKRLREATRELEGVSENLKRVARGRDEFVATISLQFHQCLTTMKHYVSAVGQEAELTEGQRENMEKALRSSDTLLKLVDELAAISRMRECSRLRFVDFPLEDLIYHVLREERPKAEAKGLRLNYLKPPGLLPKIKADPDKLGNALLHLVDNAVNYTRQGSVVIEANSEDDEIQVSVTDTGMGIPGRELPRVFTPFSRGAEAKALAREGSGLGLFLTKRIIEAHNGRMWVESIEGRGSTFKFSIPLS